MKRKNKTKSLSKISKILLLSGFFFFINPVPFGLDILPDAIGCLLIWLGLTQLSYFDGSVEEARRYTLWLSVVELIHLLIMRSVFLTNIGSNRLLAVSMLSIVQGILYIIIIKKLFGGISYYALRNNCNTALTLSDGAAFMAYLAFFIRIGATLLPELLALLEMRLSIEVNPDTYDAIASFVAMKPIIVVLLSAVALGVAVAWYFSLARLFSAFYSEAGAELDIRYANEFSSRPERVVPKKLRFATYVTYFSLFFIIDFSIDGTRIIPASFMFLLLFVSAFLFNGLSEFKQTKRLAIPAFLLLLGSELFTKLLNPNGAVVIYETDMSVVLCAVPLGLAALVATLLCVRGFLSDIRALAFDLGQGEISTGVHWAAYCVAAVCYISSFVIPYFYSFFYLPRLVAAAVFVWQTVKTVGNIYEKEYERCMLL
ncbi:MAG: hypothetical protein IKM32_03620 [Clostridia bacterium]|nr:hypothetical protein [Clostridia bacterium]